MANSCKVCNYKFNKDYEKKCPSCGEAVSKPWSYTMDYETNEIVMQTLVNGEMIHLRASEKDIKSMQSWFELAEHMKKD